MFKKLVGFDPNTTNVRTEFIAGLTTFLTMCYILAVNPEVLGTTGMDKGAVFTATALVSAVGTLLLAFIAKIPFAQAPAMGLNAFFAFTLCQAMGFTWQAALTAVFAEGIIFIILTLLNIREKIVDCIPLNLRYAISVGLGLFIAFIGLKNGNIVVSDPSTFIKLGSFTHISIVAIVGILLSSILMKLHVKGALFISILACTVIGIPLGVTTLPKDFSIISMPHSLAPTFLKFDFKALLNWNMLIIVLLMVFMDMFDTIGTLVGASAQAGLMDKDGKVPHMKEALLSDAIATTMAGMVGSSPISTYIESSAGMAEGGRSGLTSVVTGVLFLFALFFSSLFLIVPSAAITGALVSVGVLMMGSVRHIELDDFGEAMPAFITIIMMPMTYSIAEGISLGLLSYTVINLFTGNFRRVNITLYVLSILFVIRYIID
jgi:AGZA family xanthine/uracil permease-like MFS transporter